MGELLVIVFMHIMIPILKNGVMQNSFSISKYMRSYAKLLYIKKDIFDYNGLKVYLK